MSRRVAQRARGGPPLQSPSTDTTLAQARLCKPLADPPLPFSCGGAARGARPSPRPTPTRPPSALAVRRVGCPLCAASDVVSGCCWSIVAAPHCTAVAQALSPDGRPSPAAARARATPTPLFVACLLLPRTPPLPLHSPIPPALVTLPAYPPSTFLCSLFLFCSWWFFPCGQHGPGAATHCPWHLCGLCRWRLLPAPHGSVSRLWAAACAAAAAASPHWRRRRDGACHG